MKRVYCLIGFLTLCFICLVSCTETKAQNPLPPNPWESIYNNEEEYGRWWEQTSRMKVPGGYIYRCYLSNHYNGDPALGVSLVFIPDPQVK